MEVSAQSPIILIVEDELFIKMMAVDILSDLGMVVYDAGCAEEALHVLGCDPNISLLFTDMDMPGAMNGLALAARVHEKWPGIALIVTSGGQLLSDKDIPDDGIFFPQALSSAAAGKVSMR